MDDEKVNYLDLQVPSEMDHSQPILTDYVFTYDVENPNRIDKRRYLLLPCMPLKISGRMNRMQLGNKIKE